MINKSHSESHRVNGPLGHEHTERQHQRQHQASSIKHQAVSLKFCRLVCCLEMEGGGGRFPNGKASGKVYGDAAAVADAAA